ncbi:MAG: DUF1993 domain-containing protein [Bacteriovorax sp.]|nr:DUF1993 domain-containing protein [Bacteriovorax sp.]
MLYDLTVTQFTKMLNNLNHILDKGVQSAEARKFDVDVLLNARLAPDQFNLIRQVQIACDTAKLGAARLAGVEAPIHEDKEKTLPELKARINDVVKYLGTFKVEDFQGAHERKISQPRWEGKYLTGSEFAIQHAIPNIYFHITTAYAILRSNGVDVGKKDYLGEMPFNK